MKQRTVRIACFGDSLTEGYGLNPDEALPVVLEQMLRDKGLSASCLNYGVSGETAEDGLNRLETVLAANPDGVIIEFGANDSFVGDPADFIRTNLETLIKAFQSHEIPVLLVGITALTDLDDAYKASFDAIFPNLAERFDIPLFPDILSCYFGDSMLMLMDGMHPNAHGIQAIAHSLLPQAMELVETASKSTFST